MIDTKDIFNIQSEEEFNALALNIFKYQFENNRVYRSFCDLLNIHVSDVNEVREIPFLPIQFFKTHKVVSSTNSVTKVFTSSGTTGSVVSKHFINDLSIYEKSYRNGFRCFYGNIEDYVVLALLPSYLEREGSSLIHMVDDMIRQSHHSESGFYLNNLDELAAILKKLDANGKQVLLFGVSFALLDLIELHQFKLKNTIVMETGGMKGNRKEMIRVDLHQKLKKGFGVNRIHSEYGMTELLSQAYSIGNSKFKVTPWMKVLIRDTEDALHIQSTNKTGGLNIIDLANINSCSFIATQDLGKCNEDGSFEILGRFDNSDIRGCNLMIV